MPTINIKNVIDLVHSRKINNKVIQQENKKNDAQFNLKKK